jgi:late competence protein required for DNA uptake (superfamily II DNA/RNA helicase)
MHKKMICKRCGKEIEEDSKHLAKQLNYCKKCYDNLILIRR